MEEKQEKDFLKYSGNRVPRVIRLAWTILLVFAIYYLLKYIPNDFIDWFNRIK